jgi:two-component system, cell cycle response regulator
MGGSRRDVTDDFDDGAERTAVVDRSTVVSLAPLARTRKHVLIRMDSAGVGQVVTLGQHDEVTIGRLPDNRIHLTPEGISRRHARLVRFGDAFRLEDLQSANGTFVGNRRIESHILRDGDVIQFGPRVAYRYSVTDAHEEQMLRHLYEASVRDSLTGAFNRDYLGERLKSETAYARRHRTELSFVLLDLDHFKEVNDTYGHPAGDAVLIALSRHMVGVLRSEDVFARYGGEEFAVLLRGISLDGAARVGERLRELVQQNPVDTDRGPIPCTISVGCAAVTDAAECTPEQLIAIADRRLYVAKRGGRNRVVSND